MRKKLGLDGGRRTTLHFHASENLGVIMYFERRREIEKDFLPVFSHLAIDHRLLASIDLDKGKHAFEKANTATMCY